jgi:hypothetical protein
MEVSAVKLKEPMTVGERTGQAGDYLVTFADDSIGIMTAEVFEGNFEALGAGIRPSVRIDPMFMPQPIPVQPVPPAVTDPKPTGYICIGCGSDTVPGHLFDKNTGMCAECLKQDVICQTCGTAVKQYELVGTYCRKCLTKLA